MLLVALLAARTVAGVIPARPPSGVAYAGSQAMRSPGVAELMPFDLPPPPPQVGAIPAAAAALPVTALAPLGSRITIPILCYHYIVDVQPTPQNLLAFNLSISPALFAQQMALLHAEGANPISLLTLMQALSGKQSLPAHPVVLTFDDGYADFATAAEPVLARYGFVATDYVVSGFMGRPGYMSSDQVRQMDASGMVIGSHTVHHVDLASVPGAVARTEIDAGKSALERLLGHPVLDFAYPYGGFNPAVEQMVRDAGFRDSVTTLGGDMQALPGAFELHRTHVSGAPTLASFAAMAGLPGPTPAELATAEAALPDHAVILASAPFHAPSAPTFRRS